MHCRSEQAETETSPLTLSHVRVTDQRREVSKHSGELKQSDQHGASQKIFKLTTPCTCIPIKTFLDHCELAGSALVMEEPPLCPFVLNSILWISKAMLSVIFPMNDCVNEY